LIWIKRQGVDGVIDGASSRAKGCEKPTLPTGGVNEFAVVPLEPSHPHELTRGPPRSRVGEALVSLVLTRIMATVKLVAFLIANSRR